MSVYSNEDFIKNLSKHILCGSILSFLLSILNFILIYWIYASLYDVISSGLGIEHTDYIGDVLFGIIDIICVIFFIILYKKVKIKELKKAIFITVLFFSAHTLNMVFTIVTFAIINLHKDTLTAYTFSLLFGAIFCYIIFLLSYLFYLYFNNNSPYFNKNTDKKGKIYYIIFYLIGCVIFAFLCLVDMFNNVYNLPCVLIISIIILLSQIYYDMKIKNRNK